MSDKQPTIEEFVHDDIKEAYKNKEMMQDLLAFPAFIYVCELLQKQIDARIHEILGMPSSRDDEVKRTYSSGEIAGIKIALNFPKLLLEGAQGSIELEKRMKEFNNEQEEQGSQPSGW